MAAQELSVLFCQCKHYAIYRSQVAVIGRFLSSSFVISVLSSASYTEIGALLRIGVLCLGLAGMSSRAGVPLIR